MKDGFKNIYGGEMKMKQVLIYLEKNESLKLDRLTAKQRELFALGKALVGGHKHIIAKCVEKALDSGASTEEILKVVAFVVGDERLLGSIIELLKALGSEEDRRAPYISVLNDVREE